MMPMMRCFVGCLRLANDLVANCHALVDHECKFPGPSVSRLLQGADVREALRFLSVDGERVVKLCVIGRGPIREPKKVCGLVAAAENPRRKRCGSSVEQEKRVDVRVVGRACESLNAAA